MANYEEHRETGVTFVGEQDGEPERVLKGKLSGALDEFPSVQKAYLARVRYAGSEQVEVALCLFGSAESTDIVDACSREFHSLFKPTLSLDVLFLNAEQEQRLATVCKPFLSR